MLGVQLVFLAALGAFSQETSQSGQVTGLYLGDCFTETSSSTLGSSSGLCDASCNLQSSPYQLQTRWYRLDDQFHFFNTSYGASPNGYSNWASIELKGYKEVSGSDGMKYPTYCDHTHLYNYNLLSVTPADETVDSRENLEVYARTMGGFQVDDCLYDPEGISTTFYILDNEEVPTGANVWGFFCGYYTEYIWTG